MGSIGGEKASGIVPQRRDTAGASINGMRPRLEDHRPVRQFIDVAVAGFARIVARQQVADRSIPRPPPSTCSPPASAPSISWQTPRHWASTCPPGRGRRRSRSGGRPSAGRPDAVVGGGVPDLSCANAPSAFARLDATRSARPRAPRPRSRLAVWQLAHRDRGGDVVHRLGREPGRGRWRRQVPPCAARTPAITNSPRRHRPGHAAATRPAAAGRASAQPPPPIPPPPQPPSRGRVHSDRRPAAGRPTNTRMKAPGRPPAAPRTAARRRRRWHPAQHARTPAGSRRTSARDLAIR